MFNSAIQDIKEVKLADFQYKINDKIWVTNLFSFKKKDQQSKVFLLLRTQWNYRTPVSKLCKS